MVVAAFPPGGALLVAAAASATFAAVFVWFAATNHRSVTVTVTRVWRQARWICVALSVWTFTMVGVSSLASLRQQAVTHLQHPTR